MLKTFILLTEVVMYWFYYITTVNLDKSELSKNYELPNSDFESDKDIIRMEFLNCLIFVMHCLKCMRHTKFFKEPYNQLKNPGSL